MDPTLALSATGTVIALVGLIGGAFWRVRSEAAANLAAERNERNVQVTAVSAKATLAIDRANELELLMAKEYVSKANLAEALQPIGDSVATGFAHMNERIEWLRSELRSEIKVEAAQRTPRPRNPSPAKGRE